MPLPTECTKPKAGYDGRIFIVYGRPKVGKSTFCSKIPDAIFLDTEDGLSHLEVFRVPVWSWEDLLDALNELRTDNHPFRNVVIDTIDSAWRLCAQYICAKKGLETPYGANDHGASWMEINDEMRRVLRGLSKLRYGV